MYICILISGLNFIEKTTTTFGISFEFQHSIIENWIWTQTLKINFFFVWFTQFLKTFKIISQNENEQEWEHLSIRSEGL